MANDGSQSSSIASVNRESLGHGSESSASSTQYLSHRQSQPIPHIYDEVSNISNETYCVNPAAHEYAMPGETIEPQDNGTLF